jgi:hypothetical protein
LPAVRARTALAARRSSWVLVVTAVSAAGLTAATASAATAPSAPARTGPSHDEVTISQDDLRTGWDPHEPALTPAAVKGGSFGQIFSTAVDGSVFGQPLIVGSTLIAATENNWVYGLDAATGAVLWKTFLGTPYHITTSNGISPAPGPGNKPPGELAESVIRLGVNNTTGVLSARDFFSPRNAPSLDASDTDFGAGGPVGLPFGTATYPDEMMQAGKDGRIFILNRDNLGGREQGPSKGDQFLAEGGPYGGQWGHPAAFAGTPTLTTSNAPGSSDYLIYAGKKDFMREFKFGVSSSGDKPTFTDVANSSFTLGFTSGSPTITSNGTDASTGLIWEVHNNDASGSGAFLGAWQLLPVPRSGGG